ncbi:MAG: hypothetical protein AB7Y46_13725 [Armatimonadota bacterium]
MGPDLRIIVDLWTTLPIPMKVKSWSFRICNYASLDHYYNPTHAAAGPPQALPSSLLPSGSPVDPAGLNLTQWDQIETLAVAYAPLLSSLGAAIVGLDGLACATAHVEPSVLSHYESAAVRAQQFYNLAVAAWNGQTQPLDGRGYEETAIYYLGAVCHYVGDAAVVNHTYDCFLGNHEDYEDYAVGLGWRYNLHAHSGGVYGLPSAWHYVAAAAATMHTAGDSHLQQVEGPGASAALGSDIWRTINGISGEDFAAALQYALPIAERHTAGLIARFFSDISVPAQTPPLLGSVTDTRSTPIPGAFVFYTTGGGWEYTRADSKGLYRIPALRGQTISLRPAMPGYNYEGAFVKTIQGASEAFGDACPVQHSFAGFATGSDSINFRLKPLPTEAVMGVVLPVQTQQPQQVQMVQPMLPGMVGQASAVRQRLALDLPQPLNLQQPTVAGVQLQTSGGTISAGLAQRVISGLLQIAYVSDYDIDALDVPIQPDPGLPPERNRPWGNQLGELDVLLEVKHYVDLTTGQMVTTQAQLVSAIDSARAKMQKALNGQLFPQVAVQPGQQVPLAQQPAQAQHPLDMGLVQGLQMAANALPATTVQLSSGGTATVLEVPNQHEEAGLPGTLLANGLLPIPAPSGVQLQVKLLPAPGYLGSIFTQPLTLTTDQQGRAAFRLLSGTHAGKLRVAISVTSDPGVQYPQPTQSLDLLVMPRQGKDAQLVHPAMMALQPFDLPQYQQWPDGRPPEQQLPPVTTGPQPPVQVQGPPVVTGPGGPVVGPGGPVVGPGGPLVGPGQPPRPIGQVQPAPTLPGMGTQMQTMSGMMAETFDAATPQGWELMEGASVTNGALTFPSPGAAFWLIPPAANLTLNVQYRPGTGPGVVGLCLAGEPPQDQGYDLIFFPGEMAIVRRQGQQAQELGGGMIQLQPNAFNALSISLSNGQFQVSVSGQVAVQATDPQPLGPGAVALRCPEGGAGAFDNVMLGAAGAPPAQAGAPMVIQQPGQQPMPGQTPTVQPVPGQAPTLQPAVGGLSENFEGQTQGWEFLGGAQVQQAGQGRALVCSGPGHGFWGISVSPPFTVAMRFLAGEGTAELVLAGSGQPPNVDEYRVHLGEGQAVVVRARGGQSQGLGRGPLSLTAGQWHNLSVSVMPGQVQIVVNGQVVLTAQDPNPPTSGVLGFGCIQGGQIAYDDIVVSQSAGPGAALQPMQGTLPQPAGVVAPPQTSQMQVQAPGQQQSQVQQLLAQLQPGVLAQVAPELLRQIPAGILQQLPPQALQGVPPQILSQLPAQVPGELPARLPAQLLQQLPPQLQQLLPLLQSQAQPAQQLGAQQPTALPAQTEIAVGGQMVESFGGQPPGWELPPTASVSNGALIFTGQGHAFWVAAQAQNFTWSFRYQPGAGECLALFCVSGEPPNDRAYHLVLGPGGMELARVVSQQPQSLGGGAAPLQQGQWQNIVIRVLDGRIAVTAGGQAVISTTDPQPLPSGAVAVAQIAGQGAAFDDMRLTAH